MSSRQSSPEARAGVAMAVAAMSLVQLGIAASVGLAEQIGSENVAWLRLVWAGLILLLIGRPWRTQWSRSALLTCVWLGIATAVLTILFMAAVVRLPLGTASALEFLGPLGVAVARGSRQGRIWAVVAGLGVLALTEPWNGGIDLLGVMCALGAAVCWAAYIILTQRAGDEVSGLKALAVSMPVAGLVATVAVGPSALAHLDAQILIIGFGLAILLPVIPFSLELLALRRLTTASFGTLMALEPAIALVIGLVVLAQVPGLAPIVGIVLVVVAGIGAERTGSRSPLAPTAGQVPAQAEEGDEIADLTHR
jgi:inner membrane transporter RhtA